MQLGNTEDDIDLLIDHVLVRESEIDADEIANTLSGIRNIFELRFQRACNTFETLMRAGVFVAPTPTYDDEEEYE